MGGPPASKFALRGLRHRLGSIGAPSKVLFARFSRFPNYLCFLQFHGAGWSYWAICFGVDGLAIVQASIKINMQAKRSDHRIVSGASDANAHLGPLEIV